MRHDFVVEGPALRLRPVADADAAFIVALRSDPALNQYLHRGSASEAQQRGWLAAYYERPGDYYFVVERLAGGTAEGLISLYDVDARSQAAEWGRWILRTGSLAAVESAWLIYRFGFEQLHLQAIYCRTVADNQRVVSFHDSCGITQRTLLPGHFEIEGRRHDAIEHRVDRADWPALDTRLSTLARGMARRKSHG